MQRQPEQAGHNRHGGEKLPNHDLTALYRREMPAPLTARDRQKLKGRAHALEPVVQVGQAGVTDQVAKELDRALTAHELVKVKVTAPDRDAREALCDDIVARTEAAEVQRVGKVLVLWRPRPDSLPE